MANRRVLLTCGVVIALVMSTVATAGPASGRPTSQR